MQFQKKKSNLDQYFNDALKIAKTISEKRKKQINPFEEKVNNLLPGGNAECKNKS